LEIVTLNGLNIIKDESLKSLIKLGTIGHFPLFEENWVIQVLRSRKGNLSTKDKYRAKKIFKQLEKHKSWQRKKAVLLNLVQEERDAFILAFIKLVEGVILEQKPEIQ
jgi:hypothetical protein